MKVTKTKIAGLAIAMGLVSPSVFAQNMLQNYLDTAYSIMPNQWSLSLYEEAKYNDNIHNSIRGNEQDSLIFKTGAHGQLYRTKGNLTYGLQGDVSYDWYTKDSDDLSNFNWSLAPYIEGSFGKDFLQGLMISLKSRSVYEPYSRTDTRYVRHYENGIGLAYDYSRHERWGVVTTAEYTNYYYPQSKYNYSSTTNNKYNFAISPYYKVSEKIRTGAQFAYEIVDYRNDKKYDDSTNIKIMGFVDYRPSAFLNMTGYAGLERDAFDGESRGSVNDRDFEPVFAYVLRYIPNLDWTLSYNLRYEPEYGSETGRGQRQAWNNSLSLSWNATSKINFTQTFGLDINDEKNCREDTKEFKYSLRASYYATDSLTVYAGYEYDIVHFKYLDNACYHSNEFILGLRWTIGSK